ncbi:hypothetical protein [Gimesia aquarii]|uniref:hypothetical protein n=1 Tax=Gimesia aquarii TaxID=2527964 RepID=UPI00119EE796|nr:hypothetical protein [Gimesia aquarii]
MKQYLSTWTSLLLVLTLCGCGGRGSTDLLEARLRQQEDNIFALQRDLKESHQALETARHQTEAMQKQLAQASQGKILPEQTQALYKVTGVKVNSLLTGGVDIDNQEGDELWTTLVTPHDTDGETVKLPANIELELVDLNQPEANRKIGIWSFNSEEVRSHWYSGFAGSGFRFELPWQQQPANEDLTLVVRMKSQDGRTFNTTAPLKITPSSKPSMIRAVSRERLAPVEPARISFEEKPGTISEVTDNPFDNSSEVPAENDSEMDSPFRIIKE